MESTMFDHVREMATAPIKAALSRVLNVGDAERLTKISEEA
jgi:hypothetical protein